MNRPINSPARCCASEALPPLPHQKMVLPFFNASTIKMAEKAREYHIPLIHFSTDYVFDGEKEEAYVEEDRANPLGVYGQSKLAGEEAVQAVGGLHYIFRTSWVYSNRGQNFYLTMRQLSHERDEINVVADQIGVPTSSAFIAEQIETMIPQLCENNTGLYHLVPKKSCSWYDFAKQIISKTNLNFNLKNLHPIETLAFKTKAQRPKHSLLNNHKIQQAFMLKLEHWHKGLEMVINEA
ncbi:dTDP-4-dehydrorhamnose reductase [Methylophilaceae bacterium]|nr:dTDP-4-dehydrorhamnose reductase [Methylophilaceae bacterium]